MRGWPVDGVRARVAAFGRAALAATIVAALAVTALLSQTGREATAQSAHPGPRNVILFIGDGMGFSELHLARLQGVGTGGKLAMDELPYLTAMTTHALDAVVTDSAASATAIASGKKTNNHMVGVAPDMSPLSSVLEDAIRLKKSTGLVTTSRVTDATPAPFAAHPRVPREAVGAAWEVEVPGAYLDTGVDVILGGGLRNWIPKSVRGSRRPDETDYLALAVQRGYQVAKTPAELAAVDPSTTRKVLGLFASNYMSFELDRDRAKEPSLREMTAKAIDILDKNPNGFFLMVEAAKIDLAGHYWDAAAMTRDVLAMDEAVKVALDFARREGKTLLIVTADHGTGGPAVAEGLNLEVLRNVKASAEAMARRLTKDRANVREVLAQWAGITDLTEAEVKAIQAPQEPHVGGKVHKALEAVFGGGAFEIAHVISERAGVSWFPPHVHFRSEKTYGHEGSPVPLYAFGPYADRFRGLLDNTDIARIVREGFGVAK